MSIFQDETIQFPPQSLSQLHEEQYTALDQIVVEDDPQSSGSQEGEMQTSQLSITTPRYSQMNPSIDDKFYMKFYNCIEFIPGEEKNRYDVMKGRFKKFFINKSELQSGERWNRRIQAVYQKNKSYPLSNSVMIYGVDHLSNRDIKKLLKLDKEFRNLKRINWSNVAIQFSSKAELQQKIGSFLFNTQSQPFFEPKKQQDEDQMEQVDLQLSLHKLPRKWYGLRPYECKGQHIYWFVRYLTDQQPTCLNLIQQRIQFMEAYEASKKEWQKRQRNRDDYYSSMLNTSRQAISIGQNDRSRRMRSQGEGRERSRDKSKASRQIQSENFARSNVLDDLYTNNQMPAQNNDLKQSNFVDMSFVYMPNPQDLNKEAEFKKKSDEMILLMDQMSLHGFGQTLQNLQKGGDIFQFDDDMALIGQSYDPTGRNDRLVFDRKNKISDLTQLKPDERWNYTDYAEKIIEAEEQTKGRKAIPIIDID